MSIVTISSALGSSGEAIGRALAEELSYTYADREIILKAAERLGQGVAELEQLLEGRPSLRERLIETRRNYLAAVEAVIWEFAAQDNVVIVGRGSTFVLQRIRHAFRVRVTAPLHVRARRFEAERGLVPDAESVVARADRDWAARIRYLYDVALDDPLQYDLVLSTARLDVPTAVETIRAAIATERFRAMPAALAEVRDLCLTARVQAALLAHPGTREARALLQQPGRPGLPQRARVAGRPAPRRRGGRRAPPRRDPGPERDRRHPPAARPAGALTPSSPLSPVPVAPPLDVAEGLLGIVRAHAGAAAREWLAGAIRTAGAPLDRGGFATAFALAARQAGRSTPEPTPAEIARLRAAGVTWPVAPWGLDGLARAGLLLHAAAGLPPGELEALVEECFLGGDTRERQAVLRTLALLPEPERFVALAVDACRTSSSPSSRPSRARTPTRPSTSPNRASTRWC